MNYTTYINTNNTRSKQIADLEKENQWLKPFGENIFLYAASRVFNRNYNAPIDKLSLHNGVKYAENWWKLNVLYDNNCREEVKDSIMKGYELLFKFFEEKLKDDLKSSGLLIEQNHTFSPYFGGVKF